MVRGGMRWITVAILLLALAGCGSTRSGGRDVTLVLDFTPGAVHAGIYSTIARSLDRREGVRLHVIAPPASSSPLQLLQAGRADFAILDIHDLAIAGERGADVAGIMAIVQHPLAAVIAAPPIHSPTALQGQTIGVTGVPSDSAVLRSIVAGAGGSPSRLHTITIGFDAVAALLSRRVAAVTAFWSDEGVTLQHRRPGFHVFRVDRYGAPSYPELVLCARREALRADPGLARAVLRALVRGYSVTVDDPKASESDLERLVPGVDRALLDAKLRAVAPAFLAPGGAFGQLNPGALRAWSKWEAAVGIVPKPPNIVTLLDPRFLPRNPSPSRR
jgi:NitT/TauT family transport system substrate-binding protein/putative hydroxymethylpyrimidine transport system substrate-binding protein